MTHRVDVYYSYRSPYSYLATHRMAELTQTWDLEFDVRVVMPIAVRTPEFFDKVNPLWPPYLMRDVMRLGDYHEVPFRWPVPDPVVMDFATRTIASDQPHIWPVSRLGVAAQEAGHGRRFTCEAAAMMWSGEVDNWHEGDHLARAAERAGLDFAELQAAVDENVDRIDGIIATNQKKLEESGHWGVPTFVYDREPFFGQDRIDLLVWRLRKAGLERRS